MGEEKIMGRAVPLLIAMSGILLLFYVFGLVEQTGSPTSTLLGLLLNPEQMSLGTVRTIFNLPVNIALTIAGITAAIVVALVAARLTGDPAVAVLIPVSLYMLSLGWDFVEVFTVVAEGNRLFAIIIFGPLFLLWLFTMVEWWRGTD